MGNYFIKILSWTEVWATLLPLFSWIIKKPKQKTTIPVKVYLIITIVLNFWADLAYFDVIKNNHFLYSINSICRLFFFLWFFASLNIPNKKNPFIVFVISMVLIVGNFSFHENFFTSFSSNVFALEGIVLIIFCVLYFLKKLKSDEVSAKFDSALYIVMGLAIYEAVCFPVFLFYRTLIENNGSYAALLWDIVHNISYFVFCLLITRAFYGDTRRSNS
jgi:hypothetical protein